MITLNNRLKTAAELCRNGKIAVDVGCDHAQLACWLALNKSFRVIASDLRDGPLEAACRTVSECGVTNVEIVKSNGLHEIDFADDVIICGMGGELISEIIGGCRFTSADTRFILQPMTKADFLRRWLYGAGFEILEERAAYDAGKAYTVMSARFCGVKREIDEVFALTGNITDCNFLSKIAAKLRKNADKMAKSSDFVTQAEHLRELAAAIEEKAKFVEP